MNRTSKFSPLVRDASETMIGNLLPPAPRRFRATVLTNAGTTSAEVVERATEAGTVCEQTRPLGLSYPPEVFSLSHIAVPFPPTDGLYGSHPDPAEDFGIALGALAARGEVGALVMNWARSCA